MGVGLCGVGSIGKNRFQGPLFVFVNRPKAPTSIILTPTPIQKVFTLSISNSAKKFPVKNFALKRLRMFINRISYNKGRSRGNAVRGQIRFWLSNMLGFIVGFITGK